ncbi:hypothetical protein [Methylocapsa palsarum]|uniref:Uncharacterized protein n=1 Tax=Methylocapsa palsarum TaxID=1612308 RepID=A0A1I3YAJ8_9HYPH|nr:hypothetical protein [Methylocapsa palsarum]SFK28884.1 hypothetical protein SAMN05444581_105128 [Methylocapsa palsarum]
MAAENYTKPKAPAPSGRASALPDFKDPGQMWDYDKYGVRKMMLQPPPEPDDLREVPGFHRTGIHHQNASLKIINRCKIT